MDLEAEVRELLDREAIRELRYRYCTTVDCGEWDAFVNLFAEDARLEHVPSESVYEGHDGLRSFATLLAEDHHFTLHLVGNPLLSVDGDEATGVWDFIVVEMLDDETVEWLQGRYDETYRRVGDDWKITSLTVSFNYRADLYDQEQVREMILD